MTSIVTDHNHFGWFIKISIQMVHIQPI